MNRVRMILVAGVLLVAACDNKPETKPEEPASSAAPVASASAAVAAPTIADSDLSTPADFDEQAEKTISKANYKTELTALEADIAKE